jgi:hypothetical protein
MTKAMETTLGFCKCADSGTLYVTYAKLVSGVQITVPCNDSRRSVRRAYRSNPQMIT